MDYGGKGALEKGYFIDGLWRVLQAIRVRHRRAAQYDG